MRHTIFAFITCLVLTASTVWAASQTVTLPPGDAAAIVCSDGQKPTWAPFTASCPASVPIAGLVCPQAMHDAIKTPGPDGALYPTWHPPVDPISQCFYGHEHGADPSTSVANATLPPFGYVGVTVGHAPEPHEGFKVFIVPAGTPDAQGQPLLANVRIVFHMGTSRVGRYDMSMHSMIYDYVMTDGSGRSAHVQGMASTGVPGSVCDTPRKGGRDFSTVGCADPYEIWSYIFKVQHPSDPYTAADQVRFAAGGAVAASDPVLTRDPADHTRVLYTEHHRRGASFDPLLPTALYRGCVREMYVSPIWNNAPNRPGSAAVYWTDGHGIVNPSGEGPGRLRQEVTQTPRSFGSLTKGLAPSCHATTRAPN